ncbi:GNAT family N-acetyltransferase [Bacteroidia bacterium]|nr:GNAT family N-acetyltransferase [Bacteroidia bacterium]
MEQLNVHYSVVRKMEDLPKAFFVRGVVFVEGQGCAYTEDFDGLDFSAVHFLGTIGDEPVAAARIRLFKDYVKIERVAVRKEYRGEGIGKALFAFILNHIVETGYKKMVLHAQAYLLRFYENFGFIKHGELFLEANIEHYHMEKEI